MHFPCRGGGDWLPDGSKWPGDRLPTLSAFAVTRQFWVRQGKSLILMGKTNRCRGEIKGLRRPKAAAPLKVLPMKAFNG
jgi:hypothetical protein